MRGWSLRGSLRWLRLLLACAGWGLACRAAAVGPLACLCVPWRLGLGLVPLCLALFWGGFLFCFFLVCFGAVFALAPFCIVRLSADLSRVFRSLA